MEQIIEARALTRMLVSPVPVTLVDDINLVVDSGEFLVVSGASGCGKSSLLYLLGLLDCPTSGDVLIDGISTKGLSEPALAALRLRQIGFVFQFHFLLPEFTALENVMLPMERLAQLPRTVVRARAMELLDSLGLRDFADKSPQQLSGGQSQRVAIARALANEPKIILADEPTGSLDSRSSGTVRELLKDISKAHTGRCVITVTHDQSFRQVADRVITMVDGRIHK